LHSRLEHAIAPPLHRWYARIDTPPAFAATCPATTTVLQRVAHLCRVAIMVRKSQSVRMSLQTMRVLEAFLDDPTVEKSGADVQKLSAIASGTLYPILLRLESAGWFVSRWEDVDPAEVGRPRRRLYRLTHTGLTRAKEVFATLSFGRGVPA
jgi:PadR family transcriptional regulator PadR